MRPGVLFKHPAANNLVGSCIFGSTKLRGAYKGGGFGRVEVGVVVMVVVVVVVVAFERAEWTDNERASDNHNTQTCCLMNTSTGEATNPKPPFSERTTRAHALDRYRCGHHGCYNF